jgi:hypothetical protein
MTSMTIRGSGRILDLKYDQDILLSYLYNHSFESAKQCSTIFVTYFSSTFMAL